MNDFFYNEHSTVNPFLIIISYPQYRKPKMSEETTSITPTRPYMVRAIYQWIEDNALTPYLMVDATADNVQTPPI